MSLAYNSFGENLQIIFNSGFMLDIHKCKIPLETRYIFLYAYFQTGLLM